MMVHHSKQTLYYLCLLTVLLTVTSMGAQESDSTYIRDYSENFLLRVYTVTKSNSLKIENRERERSLDLLPSGLTSLGLGFNYKKFGLGLAFSLPISADQERKFGKTKRLDVQGSMYSKRIGGDAFFQLYESYYNSNPDDFIEWNNDFFPQLPDMRVLSLGVVGFYIFNDERYSYRAAFVRDEIQTKSAGSFLLGIFGNFDQSQTDNGFIPQQFPDSVRSIINLKEFKNLAFGVSVGYAHNFVIRDKFIFGIAVLPGFGYQRVSLTELDGAIRNEDQPAGQILTRAALGYEHRRFFIGITGSVNFRTIDLNPYDFNLATEQFRVTLGHRFKLKKKAKAP